MYIQFFPLLFVYSSTLNFIIPWEGGELYIFSLKCFMLDFNKLVL